MRCALVTAAAVAGLLATASPAAAQGTDIGGSVDSLLALSVEEASGFDALAAGAGTHAMTIQARVTTTEERALLSIADGDAESGPLLGRIPDASGEPLRRPLEARVGRTAAFQPLDAFIDPLLIAWRRPVANATARVELRQRVAAGETPSTDFEKTVMITLSSEAP